MLLPKRKKTFLKCNLLKAIGEFHTILHELFCAGWRMGIKEGRG